MSEADRQTQLGEKMPLPREEDGGAAAKFSVWLMLITGAIHFH